MNAVPMSARVRCKNKACGHKVPLGPEQVRELSVRLRAEVNCPACGERFSASLLRTPREEGPPAAVPPPVPIPVPTGAKKAPPPFRPLPPVRDASAPRPQDEWQPFAVATGADPLPFSPLQTAPADTGKPATGIGGWWKQQSKTTQYLILGVGIAVMAGAAFAVQTLSHQPNQHQPSATEPSSRTSPQARPQDRPSVEPPAPVPEIDQISPDQLRIAEPSPEPDPRR